PRLRGLWTPSAGPEVAWRRRPAARLDHVPHRHRAPLAESASPVMSTRPIRRPPIQRPLDGMLVLDLGQIYNGPYCGLQLGFMGARALKIEPPAGEVVRPPTRQ